MSRSIPVAAVSLYVVILSGCKNQDDELNHCYTRLKEESSTLASLQAVRTKEKEALASAEERADKAAERAAKAARSMASGARQLKRWNMSRLMSCARKNLSIAAPSRMNAADGVMLSYAWVDGNEKTSLSILANFRDEVQVVTVLARDGKSLEFGYAVMSVIGSCLTGMDNNEIASALAPLFAIDDIGSVSPLGGAYFLHRKRGVYHTLTAADTEEDAAESPKP